MEMVRHKPGRDWKLYARRSLCAVGMGYLGFALKDRGMFRTAFSVQVVIIVFGNKI